MRGSEGQAIPCKIYVSGHCLGRWIVGVASFQVGWVWWVMGKWSVGQYMVGAMRFQKVFGFIVLNVLLITCTTDSFKVYPNLGSMTSIMASSSL